MIRRHPWRTLAIAGALALPVGVWLLFIEAWWAFQGRQAWGRP